MQGSYAGSIAWFLNPAAEVSAHYLMRSSDGQVTQMVRNADKAWHARSANPYTIGIEHEGFVDNADWYTDAMYAESAKLTAYLCTMYTIDCSRAYNGVPHDTVVLLSDDFTVKGHQHYADQTHTDPGINWDWPLYHSLLNGGVIPPAVNFLPDANFTWSCTGASCSFDAMSSSDADGSIASYAWTFGDGSASTGLTASHTYAASGDFDVWLAVTDDLGARHETRRNVRASVAPTLPAPHGGGGGAIGPWVLLLLLLAACGGATGPARLALPQLGDAEYHWIAARIFENETNGKTEYLTFWGAGEDFPSMGIGHFIWFPEGVDAPFDETFPAMLSYVDERSSECVPLPEWLQDSRVAGAPWSDKASFDAAEESERVVSLRRWLAGTAPQQAQFIVASFRQRWNALELESGDKEALTAVLQELLATSEGLFAVIDYYNFKGLGSNPRERYADEGWGLVQVLGDVVAAADKDTALLEQFSRAAANRLQRRVANAPIERNEARWLEGWHGRVAAYTEKAPPHFGPAASQYRVSPYVQKVSNDGATIAWYSELGNAGTLRVAGPASEAFTSTPRLACELAYHLAEFRDLEAARSLPYRHEIRLEGLQPDSSYRMEVEQDGERASLELRTPVSSRVRFAVYGDSETEPESSGVPVAWPAYGAADEGRVYLLDQTTGYAANLAAIAESNPDFVAIAGDLVQSGGEQRDWDEFWRHNAARAASTPIVPALGNHDYFGGPGDLGGYGGEASQRALSKYQSYFGRPHYYVLDHGPIALIVLDANNGQPERSPGDTNWYLGDTAPAWQEDSEQRRWLVQALAEAQKNKAFTFVMFHPAPYSSGIHGRPPGVGDGENFSSGWPLRELTPLFLRFGVDAVFTGHDEIYEHSAVRGQESGTDGSQTEHTVHFYTVGIGGDGLRGLEPDVSNPYSLFAADRDAPEIVDDDGILKDGGKHYGHVLVDVSREEDGSWQARIEPIYVFPVMNAQGLDTESEVQSFESRVYDDVLVLKSNRVH